MNQTTVPAPAVSGGVFTRAVRSPVPAAAHRQRTALPRYVSVLSACFFLYAVTGKGFAYLGYAPLYIGEAILFYGVCVALKTRKLSRLLQSGLGVLLAALSLWGLARTIPFIGSYRIDALRDAMLWGYSLFAWVVAALALKYDACIGSVLARYRRYGGLMLVLMLLSYLATLFLGSRLPVWPGTTVTILLVKPGDMCVHVAGVACFVLVGLCGKKTWWLVAALVAFLAGSTIGRGGLLACLLAVGTAFFFYPDFRKIVSLAPGLLLALALVIGSGVTFRAQNSARAFSMSQFVSNVESVVGMESDSVDGGLNGTKQWRLNWWRTILDYTLHGPYFWTGKGFGINLTVSDGVARDELRIPGLRSPHNSHLSFLARAGVPGISLWIALQLLWVFSVLRAYAQARSQGRDGWARTFIWILCYWLAFMINAAFDVSLEGPVCAIPFWSVFGLGWAGCLRFREATDQARLAIRRSRRRSGPASAGFRSPWSVPQAG